MMQTTGWSLPQLQFSTRQMKRMDVFNDRSSKLHFGRLLCAKMQTQHLKISKFSWGYTFVGGDHPFPQPPPPHCFAPPIHLCATIIMVPVLQNVNVACVVCAAETHSHRYGRIGKFEAHSRHCHTSCNSRVSAVHGRQRAGIISMLSHDIAFTNLWARSLQKVHDHRARSELGPVFSFKFSVS